MLVILIEYTEISNCILHLLRKQHKNLNFGQYKKKWSTIWKCNIIKQVKMITWLHTTTQEYRQVLLHDWTFLLRDPSCGTVALYGPFLFLFLMDHNLWSVDLLHNPSCGTVALYGPFFWRTIGYGRKKNHKGLRSAANTTESYIYDDFFLDF